MTDIARRHYTVDDPNDLGNYDEGGGRQQIDAEDPTAVLVSSRIERSSLHVPTIDVDHHVWVEPSTTPGHGHLYIDVPMSWGDYCRLLRVMADVGIVEPGYVSASIERGATYVRLPHVRKPTALVPDGHVDPNGEPNPGAS